MTFFILALAVPGFAALALHWMHAMFNTARYLVEWYVAGQIARTRAQRGDISGMGEAQAIRQKSRNQRLSAFARLIVWSLGIVIGFMSLASIGLIFFALCNVLWFLPRTREAVTKS
jgi:hypothetical protein